MTKLGHLSGKYERQAYTKEVGIKQATELLRVRLELNDIGKNQGKERWCAGCERVKESTEHIMQCKETHEMVGVSGKIDWIKGTTEELRKIANCINVYIRRRKEKSINSEQ